MARLKFSTLLRPSGPPYPLLSSLAMSWVPSIPGFSFVRPAKLLKPRPAQGLQGDCCSWAHNCPSLPVTGVTQGHEASSNLLASTAPVAYRQTPRLCFVKPWHHSSALIWHSLVLPLSAVTIRPHYVPYPLYHTTVLRLLPAATIPVCPAGHPLSGRHLNLARPYISCDARILGQTDSFTILEILSCRKCAHVLFVSTNHIFKYAQYPPPVASLTPRPCVSTTFLPNSNGSVWRDFCLGQRQHTLSNKTNGGIR